jgi:large subunit GTPase 1
MRVCHSLDLANFGPLTACYRTVARGFARSGQGNPDESRAARYVLKDYVNAKLLFCHPPPGTFEDDFNIPTKQNALRRLEQAGKKKAPVTRVVKGADTFMHPNLPPSSTVIGIGEAPVEGQKSRALDASFFAGGSQLSARPFVQGQQFSRSKSYPHQNSIADDGTTITGRRARLLAVLANHPDGVAGPKGKKHNKGNKRIKQRSGKGYD